MTTSLSSARLQAAQLLGLTAAAGGFASGDQTLDQAVSTLSNPFKVDQFVSQHPEQAAVLDAFRNGDYDGLPTTKDGLQSLANFLNVDTDVLLTTITEQLGVSGATNGSLIALDVTAGSRSDIIQTAGHEFQHANGVDSEWLSDLGGLSTGLAFDAAALRDSEVLTDYQTVLGNGLDQFSLQANASLLSNDNDDFTSAFLARPNDFDMHEVRDGAYAHVDQKLSAIKVNSPQYESVTTQEVMSVLQVLAGHGNPYETPGINIAAIDFINDNVSIGEQRTSLLDLNANEKARVTPAAIVETTVVSAAKAVGNLPSTIPNTAITAGEGLLNLPMCLLGDCTDYVSLPRVPALIETNEVEDIVGTSVLFPIEILAGGKIAESLSKWTGLKSRGTSAARQGEGGQSSSTYPESRLAADGEMIGQDGPTYSGVWGRDNVVQNNKTIDLNVRAVEDANNVTAPIDFDGHILSGEVKPNGSVVGGHSTSSGNVRVISGTQSTPNTLGVYIAKIEGPDPENANQYLPKTNNGGMSTMFPDSWTADRVKVEVDAAYQNRAVKGNKWTGVTPSGVTVEGWLVPKTTVYPKY